MVVELGADRAAVAVDGVVAAPQDPVVGCQPVVVELVGHVADALAPRQPIDSRLVGVERLGHERVVVDRRDIAADRRQQRRDRRWSRAAPGAPARRRRRCATERRSRSFQLSRRGCTRRSAPPRRRRPRAVRRQLRRGDERGAGADHSRRATAASSAVRGPRRASSALRLLAESPQSSASASSSSSSWGSSATQQIAGGLVLGVDPEVLQILGERVEVLQPQPLERLDLIREAASGRWRSRASATTAGSRRCGRWHRCRSGSPRARRRRARVALLGVQRRPQPGEPAADDAQVGLDVSANGWCASRGASVSHQNGRRCASA